jgi:hypothetical protein
MKNPESKVLRNGGAAVFCIRPHGPSLPETMTLYITLP